MPPEPRDKLVDTKLRLSEQERRDVARLAGDRVQNTCLRRAVQQWILRETMLQEAIQLGHPIPGVHADGPIPVQSVSPKPDGHNDVTHMMRKDLSEPVESAPVSEVPPEEDEAEGETPARRRPPTSAETWGAGGPHDAS